LGVNATDMIPDYLARQIIMFQWAPTLGGECYAQAHVV